MEVGLGERTVLEKAGVFFCVHLEGETQSTSRKRVSGNWTGVFWALAWPQVQSGVPDPGLFSWLVPGA